jgi:hypothetical protein
LQDIEKVYFFLLVHVELAKSGDNMEEDFFFENRPIITHFSEISVNLVHGLEPVAFFEVLRRNLLDMFLLDSG